MDSSVVWSEPPREEDADNQDEHEVEVHGDVDESLETRRLRRWLRAMFGTRRPEDDEQ